ncbi:MAG: DUF1109 domain-containing protein [Nevskia sp.]|nr:DUF1109 domain-containing protein [Nevskia sp.]
MKTDRLIETLSTNLEPVERAGLAKPVALALLAGGLLSLAAMLATLGLSTDHAAAMGFLGFKVLFALGLVATGALVLIRSLHPGRSTRRPFIAFLALLLLAGLVCAEAFLEGSPAHWSGIVFDPRWTTCVSCIPLFAMVPFAALTWALRKGAPTNLRRTGAMAGLVAGLIGAAVYALHCPADSLLFIAVWYSAAIGFCALVGALAGPRTLRW